MALPNFFIIGAAKSGTTSLYSYLAQHPEIYMSPVKEPRFFSHMNNEGVVWNGPGFEKIIAESISDIDGYLDLFKKVTSEKAIGEASMSYLYHPKTALRIKEYVPDAKLIAILRNPVDRAYSHFLMNVQVGREPLASFPQALSEEEARIDANWSPNWHYQKGGFYYTYIKPYLENFSRSQIKIYLYEDLQKSPRALLRDIFQFLDVDETFVPDLSSRQNVSLPPSIQFIKNMLIANRHVKNAVKCLIPERMRHGIINKLNSLNYKIRPVPIRTRREMINVYRSDILKLQELIGRDLSHWLKAG